MKVKDIHCVQSSIQTVEINPSKVCTYKKRKIIEIIYKKQTTHLRIDFQKELRKSLSTDTELARSSRECLARCEGTSWLSTTLNTSSMGMSMSVVSVSSSLGETWVGSGSSSLDAIELLHLLTGDELAGVLTTSEE